MNKYEIFLNYFDDLVKQCEIEELPNEIQEVYNILKSQQETQDNKLLFTETGLEVLKFLQENDLKSTKAKDIADGMLMSSRKISGAMRKLVTDGYVDKFGANPVVYSLTEKGKNFNIENYESTLKGE